METASNKISLVMSAAWAGDVAGLRGLLEHDPSLVNQVGDAEGSRPIHYAAAMSLPAVELLLALGADPLAIGNDGNALHMAVWFGQKEIVGLLLDRRVDPKACAAAGETPLHYAALKGLEEIAAALLAKGADPDAHTTQGSTDMFATSPPVVGETPPHLAAAYGHVGLVRLLLAHGAQKDSKDRQGQTARHWAARHHQDEIVKLLGKG